MRCTSVPHPSPGEGASVRPVPAGLGCGCSALSCDEEEERGVHGLGIALTAGSAARLAVHPNSVVITEAVGSVAPRVFGAGRQGVHLKPTASAVDGLYVLSEIDLVFTHT